MRHLFINDNWYKNFNPISSLIKLMNITDDCYVVSQLYTVPGHILYLGVKYAVLNCEYNFRVNIIVGDGKTLQLMFNFQFFPPVIQQLLKY